MTAEVKGRKMFSEAYDYSSLRENLKWDDPSGTAQYLARLRLDSLVSPTIVMTDSQFLHSTFLFNLAGSAAFDVADLPLNRLQVMLRADSIEHTLMEFVKGKDESAKKLVHHIFPALDEGGELAQEVATYPRSSVRTWRDVPKILKKAYADPARVEQMERTWARVIELSRTRGPGSLSTAVWRAGFDFIGNMNTKIEASGEALFHSLKTDSGTAIFEEMQQFLKYRSKFVAHIGKLKNTSLGVEEMIDVNTIEAWYNGCYNATLAQQHGCDDVEIFDNYHCTPFDDARKLFDSIVTNACVVEDVFGAAASKMPRVKLSKGFLASLARMDSREFQGLLATEKVQNNLGAWYAETDWDAFERVCDALVEEVDRRYSFEADLSRINKIAGRCRLLTGRSVVTEITRYGGKAGIIGAFSAAGAYVLPIILPDHHSAAAAVAAPAIGAVASNLVDVVLPAGKSNADVDTKRSMIKSDLLKYAGERVSHF